jgi:hypothetical protein
LNPESVSAEIGNGPIADENVVTIGTGVSDLKLSPDARLSPSISAGIRYFFLGLC